MIEANGADMSITLMNKPQDTSLAEGLAAIVGGENVLTDEAERRYAGTDVFSDGAMPAAVIRPASVEEIQAVVRLCAERGLPLTVRGGGASYTGGYLHTAPGGVTIDTRRFDQILEINETNGYVTVQAGCRWAALHEALAERGLRTPFFGPFSGLVATVGGSMSQHAVSHGTGAFGVSAQSLLTIEVVTGTGERLATGSAGSSVARPFFRHYGPDLTGLFAGDCGALGIKAHITLPLIRRRPAFDGVSFAFERFADLHAGMRDAAQEQLDDVNFGLDGTLQRGQLGQRQSTSAKLGIAKTVFQSAETAVEGVKRVAKMAIAGERDLRETPYVAHYIVEGVNSADVEARRRKLAAVLGRHGRPIANSVPLAVRGMPFSPLTNVLGPQGERWVPMHGLFAHDAVEPFHDALQDYWRETTALRERYNITAGGMCMSGGPSAYLYEPAFYWPDARTVYHEREVPARYLQKVTAFEPQVGAVDAMAKIREDIIELMRQHGAAHLQAGKVYPYLAGRNAASVTLLKAIKAELDPYGILNPGALSL